MAPIRVALVGLNAPPAGTPSGTNWAANGHLPHLLNSDKYKLVALQNSSAERAAAAIKAYGLDAETKAYGSPEAVANDPGIDLVVSCIRVDRHAGSLVPAITAGKDVFVEWPMEASRGKAQELADLAKAHNVRHVVGLQGRYNPLAGWIRAMIARGDIGKVESSTFVGSAFGGASLPSPVDYFADKNVGGNSLTIVFSHSIEFLQQALGEVRSYKSLLVKQYPTVAVFDPVSREVVDQRRPNNVPDQIVFDAVLSSGAVLSYKLAGQTACFPDGKPPSSPAKVPSMEWRIFGSAGQIRITSYDDMVNTWSLNHGKDLLRVQVYNAATDALTDVEPVADDFAHLPTPARNVARLYEAFAAKDENVWYPDFEYGVKKHEILEAMFRENDM